MEALNHSSCYSWHEARTGMDQLVSFSCPTGKADTVKEVLRSCIRHIDLPVTGRMNVEHGGYGRYTRYDIVQRKYAGGGPGECGGGGYIEVLEIRNPPDKRWGIVLHEYNSWSGSVFFEWESVKDALRAWELLFNGTAKSELPKQNGFKRRVNCGALTPWFYAVGEEELIGDYTFPWNLQDDPVYKCGRKFVVFDHDGIPSIKTCIGCRFITRKRESYPHHEYHFRIIYWSDGTCLDEYQQSSFMTPPRPLLDSELWVTEAVAQFHRVLAGQTTGFTIPFTNGTQFVGALRDSKLKGHGLEGDYLLSVILREKDKPQKGWVNGFKPTPEAPDIVQFVTGKYRDMGLTVERLEITKRVAAQGGKKWSGVFFSPPT